LNQVVGAAVQEALHLIDVVVQRAHQRARAGTLEPRQLQPLHVRVALHAQIVLQVLREVPPTDRVQVLERRLEHPDEHGDDSQRDQLLVRLEYAKMRQK